MSPEFLFRFEWPEASVSVDSLKRYLSFPGIRIGRLYRWNRIGISVEAETEADIVHHRNRRSLSFRQNISLMSQTETRFESPPISWNTFIPKMTLSIRNVWNLLRKVRFWPEWDLLRTQTMPMVDCFPLLNRELLREDCGSHILALFLWNKGDCFCAQTRGWTSANRVQRQTWECFRFG